MNFPRQKVRRSSHSSRRASGGFTLVELLVVIAIIAVLATLVTMMASKMRSSASSAVCVTKMRQVGSAVLAYAQEHSGRLPMSPSYGALFVGQGAYYNRDDRRLQKYIGEYTGARESDTWSTSAKLMTFDPSFSWPALVSKGQPGAPSVILNDKVKYSIEGTEKVLNPWQGDKPGGTGSYIGRMVENILEPGKSQAFIEVDQKNTTAGWKSMCPPEPIHGNYRNALFFDWHVDRVPVNP